MAEEYLTKPGLYTYTPEMGEPEPKCWMEASFGHYGKHYYIDTPLPLTGQGITKMPDPHWYEGTQKALEHWKSYRVTERAFEKLKRKYPIRMVCYLD